MGYKTMLMSTDAAHSVSDSLEIPLSGKITKISENLDAMEVDMLYELETRWKEIQRYVTNFMLSQGMDGITSKEMAVMPGMELMSALFYLEDFYNNNAYDLIVMDTAPTGETLRLLSFPEVSEWYSERMYKVLKNMLKLARMTVGRMVDMPLPSDELLRDLEDLAARMRRVRDILTDPEITSIRLVVNPEKMVINETKRAFTYFCLYGLIVDGLIVNRLYPDDADDYFKDKLEEQNKYMEVIKESFSPLEIMTSFQQPVELVGIESLEKLGDMLFGDVDPTVPLSLDKPLDIFTEDKFDVISIKLPFIMKEEVNLFKTSDSLLVEVGQYRRSITLPVTLANKEPFKAEFRDNRLLIKFREEEGDDGTRAS